MSKPNLTKAVNALIEMGHIKRQRDEHDRRKVNLFITESGKEEVERRRKEVLQMIREKLAPLSGEDQNILRNHFIGIQDILNKLEE